MTSIQPGWLGVPVVVIVVAATVLVVTAVLYGLVPPTRRFIKGERPVWWVRDGFLAVFVAVLVLFGHSYIVTLSAGDKPEQGQDQDQRLSDLDFVRSKSSEVYQVRPFRGFDLRDMNLAGLQLRGADFTEADLSGANLTGTDLVSQAATPEASGRPATPGVAAFLQGVNFCHAVLTRADLRYSFLMNANLVGADLALARLQGAALNGSDFSGATMPSDASYLEGIYYDDDTIWPEGFEPPPSNTGNKLVFLENPVNNALYGDIQRPACNS